jgi:hypothetical protein
MNQKHVPSSSNLVTRQLRGLKMIWALLLDGRVPLLFKLIILGAFLWVIFPDLIPGPLDDLGVAALAPQLFLDLCRDRCSEPYKEHYGRIYPES